jgi:hypothetical protein
MEIHKGSINRPGSVDDHIFVSGLGKTYTMLTFD